MNKLIYILPLLLLVGCSKPAPAPVVVPVPPPVVVAPVVAAPVATVVVAKPTVVVGKGIKDSNKGIKDSNKGIKDSNKGIKDSNKRVAKRVGMKRVAKVDTELDARAKVLVNTVRVDCLDSAVDQKLDWDVKTGVVHDLGNVRTAPVCIDYLNTNKATMAQAKLFLKKQDKLNGGITVANKKK